MVKRTNIEEPRLSDLLTRETERQKRSYRHATVTVVMIALAGAAWLIFSAISVSRLERRAKTAKAEIERLNTESGKLQARNDEQKRVLADSARELAETLNILDSARKEIEEGRSQKAFQIVSKELERPWAIVTGGDRDLETARSRRARVEALGFAEAQVLVCLRENVWRTLIVFSDKRTAANSLGKVQTEFQTDTPYLRDLNLWCVDRQEVESGVCKCQ